MLMPVDAQAAIDLLKELRALTADENGAQRLAWSPVWLKAREWFQSKLSELPVEHHLDAAGNSWTTLTGSSEKTLILGSHLGLRAQWRLARRLPRRDRRFAVLRRIAESTTASRPSPFGSSIGPMKRRALWAQPLRLFGICRHAQHRSGSRAHDAGGMRLEDALAACGVNIDAIGDAGA
jgi:N-carbamoyl-L-amino-acid hydrolase